MFTGIVDRTAVVSAIDDRPGSRLITLRVGGDPGLPPWRAAELGSSVAVNGVCLTAVAVRTIDTDGVPPCQEISFEAVPETLQLTTLGQLAAGDTANVETSLAVGDIFGGHYVTGHIDGMGTVRDRIVEGDQVLFKIGLEPQLIRQVIHKGSIAVDGISLTIVSVDHQTSVFEFAAIPHTLERTALGARSAGSMVNIETDAFGKWVLHGFEQAGLLNVDLSRIGDAPRPGGEGVRTAEFPLHGVVGIVGGGRREVSDALIACKRLRPAGIEVRADLFEPISESLDVVARIAREVPTLFTVRLQTHGGRYAGGEEERYRLYLEALRQGAVLVDAECDSPAALRLAERRVPLVVSHHDFDGMIEPGELGKLEASACEMGASALKVVPTATTPADGLRMLQWVSESRADGPLRIGFAMGEIALFSRVLALAWGSPITYAPFGRAVAPGQVSVGQMLDLYRAPTLSRESRLYGIAGNPVAHHPAPSLHNPALQSRRFDAVYLPFLLDELSDIQSILDGLPVEGLSLINPFKEDACAFAGAASDERSLQVGAASAFVKRSGPGARMVQATNTEIDGFIGALGRHDVELEGLSVAVLGQDSVARAAALALKSVGGHVTLYFQDEAGGPSVAETLGVGGLRLEELRPGRHQLIINATAIGREPGGPSRVPASVFTPETTAFETEPTVSKTAFLRGAAQGGAAIIQGRELLISQGLAEFRLFTSQDVSYEEFDASYSQLK